MKRTREYSSFRSMWLFAMFDVPVKTKPNRKRYAQFRKLLLLEGFTMLQFSVYARHFESEEASEAIRNRIRDQIPDKGQVRLVPITDRQFSKMDVYYGKTRSRPEREPEQYLLF